MQSPNHPWGFHGSDYRRSRFRGRFMWFFVGGLTAALFLRSKDWRESHDCGRRAQLQARSGDNGSATLSERRQVAPLETRAVGWEREREQVEELKTKASDAVTEFSEATLDTILETANTLKAKLAEHRMQLDETNKLRERELEEQKKAPVHRWV